jgi:hypothetical protein
MIHLRGPWRGLPPVVMMIGEDASELAAARSRRAQADRNSAWLQAHAAEVYTRHRGKCIVVAGEELFVGDTPREAWARASAAHPEDGGKISRYVPKEKGPRIYADRRPVADLR